MALESGRRAHRGDTKFKACTKSAGKIRLGGESLTWEIAGKKKGLDIVFPASHAQPLCGAEAQLTK
jgi:hypothetical protein